MNYSAMIQSRKSVRAFKDVKVATSVLDEIKAYYKDACQRLVPELETELFIFSDNEKEALEGAAGYNKFLIGASQYMVLLSAKGDLAGLNAGYVMEDMILKLTEMDLDSCWLTFTDSEKVKAALAITSDKDVVAVAAFGYGAKAPKRLRLNILSMSSVDVVAERKYFEPKRSVYDMAFMKTWGNTEGLDEYIGFYDNVLWEALYAASLSPSYLNRQAYGFVIDEAHNFILVKRPDEYTTEIDGKLSLGIVMHHFSCVAEQYSAKVNWSFGKDAVALELPEGYEVVASCKL